MNINRQLADHIIALAKSISAEDGIGLSDKTRKLDSAIQESGGIIQPIGQAKIYVCLLQEEIPTEILMRHTDIICIVRNGNNKELVLHSFWNGISDSIAHNVGTVADLQAHFEPLGYGEANASDIETETSVIGEDAATSLTVAERSLAGRYITWCKEQTSPTANCSWLVRLLKWGKCSRDPKESVSTPFLTVLTRTQGRREDGLTEVMLCLAAQTDRDFEWVIIGHKLSDQEEDLVSHILSSAPSYLGERIKYYPCNEEGRTAPLNFGFSMAHGQYIAILDDDDIVMDNWVEEFHKAAPSADGAILHAYAVLQNWQYIPGFRRSSDALRATSNFNSKYCRPYDKFEQFTTNYCPPVCLAFPAYAFREWHIHFDEKLDMTEDWDYLTRVAVLCGVYDIQNVTCIYRWWKNGETSATLYSQKEWQQTYEVLTNRFSHLYLPVQAKELHSATTPASIVPLELFATGDNGDFNPSTMRSCEGNVTGAQREFVFSNLPQGIYQGLLRIDPCYFGGIVISDLKIVVTTYEEETISYGMDDVTSNGWRINGEWAFLQEDPQFYFHIPHGYSAKAIQVSYIGPKYMSALEAKFISGANACSSAQLVLSAEYCKGPVPAQILCSGNLIECVYSLKDFGTIYSLDFSPCLRGSVITQNMRIQAEAPDGTDLPLHWKHNGVSRPDAAIFLQPPHYRAKCNQPIAMLRIEFRLDGEISEGAALSLQNPIKYLIKKINNLLP